MAKDGLSFLMKTALMKTQKELIEESNRIARGEVVQPEPERKPEPVRQPKPSRKRVSRAAAG